MTARLAVDVVDLRRIERLHADTGAALERRLLHPSERERLDPGAGAARALAAALAAKEAWIKLHGGRPAGWSFDRTAFAPLPAAEVPEAVAALVGRFVEDLGVAHVETGAVRCGGAGRAWGWHGTYEHWLIAGVVA